MSCRRLQRPCSAAASSCPPDSSRRPRARTRAAVSCSCTNTGCSADYCIDLLVAGNSINSNLPTLADDHGPLENKCISLLPLILIDWHHYFHFCVFQQSTVILQRCAAWLKFSNFKIYRFFNVKIAQTRFISLIDERIVFIMAIVSVSRFTSLTYLKGEKNGRYSNAEKRQGSNSERSRMASRPVSSDGRSG